MENKITKGPWRYEAGSGLTVRDEAGEAIGCRPYFGGFKIKDAKGRSVCAYSSAGNKEEAEQEANARAIAAVPEMLAALEMYMEDMEYGRGVQNSTVNAARAALKKAKGEN